MNDRIIWRTLRNLKDRRGTILVVVVWVIALLSFLAAALGSEGVFALDLTNRLTQQLQASYIARAGVRHALAVLERDVTPTYDALKEGWANSPPLFAQQRIGSGVFTISYPGHAGTPAYGLTDEDRKLNLNTVPEDVLRTFLQMVGHLKEADAKALADAIQDWRDEDTKERPYGAEKFYYLGLREPYECKDGPFENVEELLLVKGMTPKLFVQLTPFLTVYGSGRVNLNTANPEVLRALGLSEEGVNGIVFYRAGEDNTEGTGDDRVFNSVGSLSGELASTVPAEDLNRLATLAQANLLTVHSEGFRIAMTAQTESTKSAVHLEAVVNRSGQINAWAER